MTSDTDSPDGGQADEEADEPDNATETVDDATETGTGASASESPADPDGDTPDPADSTDEGQSGDGTTGVEADQSVPPSATEGERADDDPQEAEKAPEDTAETAGDAAEAAGSPSSTASSDSDGGESEEEVTKSATRNDTAGGEASTDGESPTPGQGPADITPDEVAVSRPDEFEFRHVPKDQLPPNVQYTPDFDPAWVYPSGAKDGGIQDDVPVQGLEIGVLATEESLEAVVDAVLEALGLYYEAVGEYPRHRIIKSAEAFRESVDGSVGFAAVFQPRPDGYEGLTDHMTALTAGETAAVDSNTERARRLVQYLVGSLVYHELAALEASDADQRLPEITGWEIPRVIGDTRLVEHYGPLAATEIYDPTDGAVDISADGVETLSETNLSPTYLGIDDVSNLF